MRIVGLLFVLMLACKTPIGSGSPSPLSQGPNATTPDTNGPARNESGSRLTATYLDGEDGSRAFVGFYDTIRKEDCSFQLAGDGKMRCMPAAANLVDGSGYFADAECTKQLAHVVTATSCGAGPRYAAVWDYGACPAPSVRIFEIGEQYTGDIYSSDGSCTAIPRPATLTFYELDDAVRTSEFAAAVRRKP